MHARLFVERQLFWSQTVAVALVVPDHLLNVVLRVAEVRLCSQRVQQHRVQVEYKCCVFLGLVAADVSLAFVDRDQRLPMCTVAKYSNEWRSLAAQRTIFWLRLVLACDQRDVISCNAMNSVEHSISFGVEVVLAEQQFFVAFWFNVVSLTFMAACKVMRVVDRSAQTVHREQLCLLHCMLAVQITGYDKFFLSQNDKIFSQL